MDTEAAGHSSRAPRNTLSHASVVAAAVALADDHGLDAVTIRALAGRMGVTPMAIYHHVPSKADLLDRIVDAVYEQITRSDSVGTWRTQLRDQSVSTRRVLVHHPWVVAMVGSRTSPTRHATIAHHENVLATLARAGADPRQAIMSALLLDAFVWGFVVQELSMPSPAMSTDLPDDARHARAALRTLEQEVGLLDRAFAEGLDLALDGIAARLAQPTVRS